MISWMRSRHGGFNYFTQTAGSVEEKIPRTGRRRESFDIYATSATASGRAALPLSRQDTRATKPLLLFLDLRIQE